MESERVTLLQMGKIKAKRQPTTEGKQISLAENSFRRKIHEDPYSQE
jgi:hypothetical protein